MDSIAQFQEEHPSLESYWRSVILFGQNVASYKFALAKSLLRLAEEGKTEITLAELAVPYSQELCAHLKVAPKQVTSKSSKFLEICKQYNDGNAEYDELIATTVKLGFNNVIDAFHNVNNATLPVRFYEKDYKGGSKKIILTDELYQLANIPHSDNLIVEAESRWKLVETAWALNVNRNLLNVRYDDKSQLFYVDEQFRRKDVTSARGALDGYQKGKCFYCYDDIAIDGGQDCDVDHFFPHTLQQFMPNINFDGVWNLVLSCPQCNRGVNGKFAKVPDIKYLERLHKRNEFLISSHHLLRETIIKQTGKTEAERRFFLQSIDTKAIQFLIQRWHTEQIGEATF